MERFEHYFIANVTTNEKKKSILLTVCGLSTFELAKGLFQLNTFADTSYEEIVKALKDHYCPKPSNDTILIPDNVSLENPLQHT